MDTVNSNTKSNSKKSIFILVGIFMILVLFVLSLIFVVPNLLGVEKSSTHYTFNQISSALKKNDSATVMNYVDIDSIKSNFVTQLYQYTITRTATSSGLSESLISSLLTKDLVEKMVDPKSDLSTRFANFIQNNNNDELHKVFTKVVDYLAANTGAAKVDSTSTVSYTMSTSYGDIRLNFNLTKNSDGVVKVTSIDIIDGWDALVKFLNLN